MDEEGCEASAVTVITAMFGCAALLIECNRSFHYAVVDNALELQY